MTRAEMNWKIFRSLLPLVVLVAFAYFIERLKPDYFVEEPHLSTDSYDLLWRFQMNEGDELINKIVEISGDVTRMDSTTIIISNYIHCFLDPNRYADANVGENITLKGLCLKYSSNQQKVFIDNAVQVNF